MKIWFSHCTLHAKQVTVVWVDGYIAKVMGNVYFGELSAGAHAHDEGGQVSGDVAVDASTWGKGIRCHFPGWCFLGITLLFGLHSAPKIFSVISDTLEWILCQRGMSSCLHYIDNFLTLGRAGSDECSHNFQLSPANISLQPTSQWIATLTHPLWL